MADMEASRAKPPPPMPPAAWYWRLPVIRHVRYYFLRYQVAQHYEYYLSIGMLPVHMDRDLEILEAIWRGEF